GTIEAVEVLPFEAEWFPVAAGDECLGGGDEAARLVEDHHRGRLAVAARPEREPRLAREIGRGHRRGAGREKDSGPVRAGGGVDRPGDLQRMCRTGGAAV